MLPELELKLLRLCLDPAASKGEIENSAVKLVLLWRKRGLTAEELNGQSAEQTSAVQYYAPDYGLCTMPFGKHKGAEFKDIPPSYLAWLLGELKQNPNNRYPNLATEIQEFLAQ